MLAKRLAAGAHSVAALVAGVCELAGRTITAPEPERGAGQLQSGAWQAAAIYAICSSSDL